MPIELNQELMLRLLSQSETGMGYQIVDVNIKDTYLIKEAIVFNAEYLFYLDKEDEIKKISMVLFSEKIEKVASLSTDIIDLKVKSKLSLQKFSVVGESNKMYPAESSPVVYTNIGEKFKRFTGFKNDRRINHDGSLKPGTYAATEEDAKNIRIRIDAIRRYALPPGNIAQYVFTIEPLQNAKIRRGIVQANYGQPGEGIEIIFVEGTTANTVKFPPQEVPEK